MKKQHIIIIAVIVVFWIGHGIIASNNRQTENTTTENIPLNWLFVILLSSIV